MPTPRWWLILWAITVAGCESTSRIPNHPVAPVDNPVSIKELAPPVVEREPVPTDVWAVLRDGFELNHATHEPSVARAVDIYLASAQTLDIEVQARRYLAASVPVGAHLADQLLTVLALNSGGSFRTLSLTQHAQTNADVIKRFVDVEINETVEARDITRVDVEIR